jgi:outer membrane protein assembly factor BamB
MSQQHLRLRVVAPGFLAAAAVLLLLTAGQQPAHGYIDLPLPSLAKMCEDTPAIAVLRVEQVNRAKKAIVYSKVRDLKGTFPTQGPYFGDTFTHVMWEPPGGWIVQALGPSRLEMYHEAILAWAAEGKTAVIFQRGGEQAVCVGPTWYHARPGLVRGSDPGGAPPKGQPWVYGVTADPRLARLFCGEAEDLVGAVSDLLAGKAATVPRMVGTMEILYDRTGPIERLPADYDDAIGRKNIRVEVKEFHDPFPGQAPWSTHRGNPRRTGADGPGPKAPKVLWVHRSEGQFLAPLVPGARDLYAPSLGADNTPGFQAFALDPAGEGQVRWAKGSPLLRQPVAGSPALLGGPVELLAFGDGVHTDDGGTLRCLRAADGFPLWQLPVPGKVVHFEGTPTYVGEGRGPTAAAAARKLYVGGGSAGVLCLDPGRVTFEGKEQNLSAVQAALERRWTELLAQYEAEKKKDPQSARPPDEALLPPASPRRVWQQGEGRWHVDAPVAVVEDRVLAASAYRDDEKAGERALVCLRAGDGAVVWKAPLGLNPWAGPTVGPYVLVGCSSVRFDPKAVAGATGEVVAVELDTGAVKWRKAVPGGVLSSVAVRAGLAVFTATDGKVRAWDTLTGRERWSYDAGAAFFAGPAVTDRTVYAADLKGSVHAIGLADGQKEWVLDLAADPATRPAGMVYGSPVVHGGRLYLATCDLGDRRGQAADVVVCIGEH